MLVVVGNPGNPIGENRDSFMAMPFLVFWIHLQFLHPQMVPQRWIRLELLRYYNTYSTEDTAFSKATLPEQRSLSKSPLSRIAAASGNAHFSAIDVPVQEQLHFQQHCRSAS